MTRTWLRASAAFPFAAQFVVLDLVIRGRTNAGFDSSAALASIESVLVWLVLLAFATTTARRVLLGVLAASVLVLQTLVFRYYAAPLDIQVATSAIHAWADVRRVVVRLAPVVMLSIVVTGILEVFLLTLVHRATPVLFSVNRRANLRTTLLAFATCAGLSGVAPRRATPEIRAAHALGALAEEEAPPAPGALSLPPLRSERAELPNVMFVLTESVRASDYVVSGEGATAEKAARATKARVDFSEMRAVSSYTAISLSAILTGLAQTGARDDILRAPTLFDFAHATRDRAGRRPTVAYVSSHARDVFESRRIGDALDTTVTVETFFGRPYEPEAGDSGADRFVFDWVEKHVSELPHPHVVFVHLLDTHAPYVVDAETAPFRPYDHVVAWSRMDKLHNAYKSAIALQDAGVARAIDAFVAHSAGHPWVIFFTSDHGEAFGEHGAIHHGQNLYDEQIHVPAWIVASPDVFDAAQKKALNVRASRGTTHLDLLPTFLELMGLRGNSAIAPYAAAMAGTSLLTNETREEPIPISNCTGMFPCPVNAWGLLARDRKLVARVYDFGWECIAIGSPNRSGLENVIDAADPACLRLKEHSKAVYPTLPNGAPNR